MSGPNRSAVLQRWLAWRTRAIAIRTQELEQAMALHVQLDLRRMDDLIGELEALETRLHLDGASAATPDSRSLESITSVVEGVYESRAVAVRTGLADALTPRLTELDPVPHATIEQAKRRAALRTELLLSGAFTLTTLAEGRSQSMGAVRQWVHRARQRGAIFTVQHDGETLVPAFLLDEDLEPRPEYVGAIEALTAVGSKGWALWAWFALPSGWLDGRTPAAHALVDPDDVTRAARDRASNAR